MAESNTGPQALKYALLSISAGLVDAGSFALLTHFTPLPFPVCQVISVSLSVLYNFTLNRRYTFRSANSVPAAMVKVALFYAVFIPVTAFGGQAAVRAGVNPFIVKGVTLIMNFVLEFQWWKYVVFRGTEDTNDVARKAREHHLAESGDTVG